MNRQDLLRLLAEDGMARCKVLDSGFQAIVELSKNQPPQSVTTDCSAEEAAFSNALAEDIAAAIVEANALGVSQAATSLREATGINLQSEAANLYACQNP